MMQRRTGKGKKLAAARCLSYRAKWNLRQVLFSQIRKAFSSSRPTSTRYPSVNRGLGAAPLSIWLMSSRLAVLPWELVNA